MPAQFRTRKQRYLPMQAICLHIRDGVFIKAIDVIAIEQWFPHEKHALTQKNMR